MLFTCGDQRRRTESGSALEACNAIVVWLSNNTLVSINVVTLRQARLVPGWVTA